MNLHAWARKWAISGDALRDLAASVLALDGSPVVGVPGASEAAVQARTRVRASQRGLRVWRNNVGAYHDEERGVHVRYGLCNDSPQVNAQIKSADLVGIAPRIIQPQDVGTLIGQFVSLEVKHAGWKHRPNDEHEQAQVRWALLVQSLGGDARFVSDESQV